MNSKDTHGPCPACGSVEPECNCSLDRKYDMGRQLIMKSAFNARMDSLNDADHDTSKMSRRKKLKEFIHVCTKWEDDKEIGDDRKVENGAYANDELAGLPMYLEKRKFKVGIDTKHLTKAEKWDRQQAVHTVGRDASGISRESITVLPLSIRNEDERGRKKRRILEATTKNQIDDYIIWLDARIKGLQNRRTKALHIRKQTLKQRNNALMKEREEVRRRKKKVEDI